MEDDRAEANLGSSAPTGLEGAPPDIPRLPKKRFVGRKTVEREGRKQGYPNGTNGTNIEDTGTIQGEMEAQI